MKSSLYLLVLLLCSCASYKPQGYITHVKTKEKIESTTARIKLPAGQLLFLGKTDMTGANAATGQMMYPGYNAAGFLAAIFTHAAISGSVQDKQKIERQNQANKVLEPYQPALAELTTEQLTQALLAAWSNADGQLAFSPFDRAVKYQKGELILECLPSYFLSGNEETLTLRTTVAFYRVGQEKKPIYQNQIEVYSEKLAVETVRERWLGDDSAYLIATVNALFAESIKIAVDDAFQPTSQVGQVDENFKYIDGVELEFERGSRVVVRDGRMLIRTLRGWLKSIPLSRITSPAPATLAQQGL